MSSVADRITSGFVNGDHSLVVSLLSQVVLLKNLRVKSFSFPIVGPEHRKVPLLNLAAWHGWLDVASQLICDYHCDAQSTDSVLATPLHYAARGGRIPNNRV